MCGKNKYISEIYTLHLIGFWHWVVRGVSHLYMRHIEVNICAEVVVAGVVDFVDVVNNVVADNAVVFDVVDDVVDDVAVDYMNPH